MPPFVVAVDAADVAYVEAVHEASNGHKAEGFGHAAPLVDLKLASVV